MAFTEGRVAKPERQWGCHRSTPILYIWVTTLTFKVTSRHWSRDQSIRHMSFPIGVSLKLNLYL